MTLPAGVKRLVVNHNRISHPFSTRCILISKRYYFGLYHKKQTKFAAMNPEEQLKTIVDKIVGADDIHAKWLNSLSMMENTGARKISKYEHPVHTGIIVL